MCGAPSVVPTENLDLLGIAVKGEKMSKFNQFTTLDKELVDALASIGFVELSPIQEKQFHCF